MFRRLRRRGGAGASGAEEQVLRLQRDLQEHRLELARRDETVKQLRGELDRVRDAAEEQARQRIRAEVERVVTVIGSSLTQLTTQAHLHHTGTAIRLDDVLDVGMRLVRSLREVGVDTVGEVGQPTPFDPDRHDPLDAGAHPAVGQAVRVRVTGLSYQDTVVRKAGVDVAGER